MNCSTIYARASINDDPHCRNVALVKCADCGNWLCEECSMDCQNCKDVFCKFQCLENHIHSGECCLGITDFLMCLVARVMGHA